MKRRKPTVSQKSHIFGMPFLAEGKALRGGLKFNDFLKMNKFIFYLLFFLLFSFHFSHGQNISYKLYLAKYQIYSTARPFGTILVKLYDNNMFILYRSGIYLGYATGIYEKKKRKIILHPYNSGKPTAYLEYVFIGKEFFNFELYKHNFKYNINYNNNMLILKNIKSNDEQNKYNLLIPEHIFLNDSIKVKNEFKPFILTE